MSSQEVSNDSIVIPSELIEERVDESKNFTIIIIIIIELFYI